MIQGSYTAVQTASGEKSRQFLLHVYNWMSLGLAFTAVVALWIFNSQDAMGWLAANRGAFYGLLIAEFIIVLAFSAVAARASYATVLAMFIAYAGLNGVTLSFIFLVYTQNSIASAFFITAGTFAGTSLYGMVTKRDLTGVGHFMGMALWGIILAMVVNMFIGSSQLSYITSVIAVIVFVGLTAYDTQKLRRLSAMEGFDDEDPMRVEIGDTRKKLALSGALMLYLDFINLFLNILRLTGNRRS